MTVTARALPMIALVALALPGCDALKEAGLDGLFNAIDGVELPAHPTAKLASVVLDNRPTDDQLTSYFCEELASRTLCRLVLDPAPAKSDLKFSFVMTFDLGNANGFPIPLVELLLALDVFEGSSKAELGAVCVSFCNPEDPQCASPKEACKLPETLVTLHCECACNDDTCEEPTHDLGELANPTADQLADPLKTCEDRGATCADGYELKPRQSEEAPPKVPSLDDFEPTVEDLVDLAKAAADGSLLDENLKFRYIPAVEMRDCRPADDGCEQVEKDGVISRCCGDECTALDEGCTVGVDDDGQSCASCPGRIQARIRFDLGIEAILSILEEVASESINDILDGRSPDFDIPYKVRGTVFFDLPIIGRFALEFGPFSSVWSVD